MRHLFGFQARLLFWKEIHQVTRSPVAMVTAVALPGALVVLAPILSLVAPGTRHRLVVPHLEAILPGFTSLVLTRDFLLYVSFPMLFVLASLLTPLLLAPPIVVVERERRSVELLAALPVDPADIVAAKLMATLATAASMVLPMYAIDAAVILSATPAGTAYVGTLLFLIVATLLAATAATLLVALLARDSRTASHLAGLLVIPGMFATALCLVFVPGNTRFVVLGLTLLVLAGIAVLVGLRQLRLERYLL